MVIKAFQIIKKSRRRFCEDLNRIWFRWRNFGGYKVDDDQYLSQAVIRDLKKLIQSNTLISGIYSAKSSKRLFKVIQEGTQ